MSSLETASDDAPQRRSELLAHMESLDEQSKTCRGCTGKCCTFVANSMQVTPLETLDLYHYLLAEKRWTPELKQELAQNIKTYRLDQEVPGNGRRLFMRRHYTCPFFSPGGKGCSISPEFKPYGCLAFNAKEAGISDGENCGSKQDLLEKFENPQFIERNVEISEALGLDWVKKDIPSALLDLDKIFNRCS